MIIHYFKGLVEQHGRSRIQDERGIARTKAISVQTNHAGDVAARRDPLHPVQIKLSAALTWSYGPKSELWTRMYHFYSLNRAEFLQHYHKRSNVETTFHMIKSKFGQRLRSKHSRRRSTRHCARCFVITSAL